MSQTEVPSNKGPLLCHKRKFHQTSDYFYVTSRSFITKTNDHIYITSGSSIRPTITSMSQVEVADLYRKGKATVSTKDAVKHPFPQSNTCIQEPDD